MKFRPLKKGRSLIINITSLIDVMFLLLIFFMVTSTFRNQPAINLVLPRSATANETTDTPSILFLTASGKVYLNDTPLTLEELPARLEQLKVTSGEDRMVLRGDEKVAYGKLVGLIDLLKQSGFTRVSLSARGQAQP